jgi:O-antigen ligase
VSRALPLLAIGLAVTVPVLFVNTRPPSHSVLVQTTAIFCWGLAAFACTRFGVTGVIQAAARARNVLVALVLVATAAVLSAALGSLPWPHALSGAGIALCAAAMLMIGTAIKPSSAMWSVVFGAWVFVGLANTAIGAAQVFMPRWDFNAWFAFSQFAGRAVGNLRQPNHLATVLLWSCIAVVPLLELKQGATSRFANASAALAMLWLLFGIVMSGSRTGLVGVLILALWGIADKRLSRWCRMLLVLSPLVCFANWHLLDFLTTSLNLGTAGISTRFDGSELSSHRFAIWGDAISLIREHPLLGVGYGEFNFAWSLTPFPGRSTIFFDNAHNLPLHLIAELGLPLGALVLLLLASGLFLAARRSLCEPGSHSVARRASLVMLLVVLLHSLLEYPLWYAHFLLPCAFAWGLCLGAGKKAVSTRDTLWPALAGSALVLGAILVTVDYRRASMIYIASDTPIAQRILLGRGSWFFAHHADYAIVTNAEPPVTLPGAFDRTTHHLLDTRLMIAWASTLAAQGDIERARYLADRLREFRNPASADFFSRCHGLAAVEKPFQCTPATRAFSWRDFAPD